MLTYWGRGSECSDQSPPWEAASGMKSGSLACSAKDMVHYALLSPVRLVSVCLEGLVAVEGLRRDTYVQYV